METTTIVPLQPTGVLVQSIDSQDLLDIDIDKLRSWIDQYRLVILRGIKSPDDHQMRKFCELLGTILEWEFGAVNELTVKQDTKSSSIPIVKYPFIGMALLWAKSLISFSSTAKLHHSREAAVRQHFVIQ